MSVGINLLMYLTEITSGSLGKRSLKVKFLKFIINIKDYPSGTALMLERVLLLEEKKISIN